MTASNDTRDPVEALAEEFLARRRSGERVTAQEYADAHPELADAILDLFPTMLALERLGDDDADAAPTPAAFEHPTQLGDLRLLREIGRGGMGIVYEAEQESLGRRVAVKILPERALFDTKRLERFRREARTAGSLQHPSIVPIYGVGEQDGLHYLSMQLIEGAGLDVLTELVGRRAGSQRESSDATQASDWLAGSLAHAMMIDDFQATSSVDLSSPTLADPLPSGSGAERSEAPTIALSEAAAAEAKRRASMLAEEAALAMGATSTIDSPASDGVGVDYFRSVAKIGIQAAEALAYAHARGTLHRDIKPANLLLDRRGGLWITDFGLAKAMEDNSVSRTGELVGTLRYMAPEQLSGDSGPRSDLYSLGLTLYELVAWQPAFEASAPSELIRKITSDAPARPRTLSPQTPVALETIILKAIARDPDERYQTGDDLAADLRRFLEGIPVEARREGHAGRAVRWTRQNPLVAGLASAVVLLSGATLLAMSSFFRAPPRPPAPPTAATEQPAAAADGASDDLVEAPVEGPPSEGRRDDRPIAGLPPLPPPRPEGFPGPPPTGEFRSRPPRGGPGPDEGPFPPRRGPGGPRRNGPNDFGRGDDPLGLGPGPGGRGPRPRGERPPR